MKVQLGEIIVLEKSAELRGQRVDASDIAVLENSAEFGERPSFGQSTALGDKTFGNWVGYLNLKIF